MAILSEDPDGNWEKLVAFVEVQLRRANLVDIVQDVRSWQAARQLTLEDVFEIYVSELRQLLALQRDALLAVEVANKRYDELQLSDFKVRPKDAGVDLAIDLPAILAKVEDYQKALNYTTNALV